MEVSLSNPIILLGDKTSHSGTVISGSQFSDTNGKGWARVGDMVACPRCKGMFPISQGDASLIDDGHAVAYHGCKVACGALLISSQQFTLTAPSSGAASGSAISEMSGAILQGFGAIGAGLAGTYHDEAINEENVRFRGRFQVVDATTGEPVKSQAVRVRSTSGQYVTGTTDADGFTDWVERDINEALAFDLLQDGDA